MAHNHAAYAPEDVDDARRGAPTISLEPWAAARGLTFGGSVLAGAFVTVLPLWKDYVFNSCRGEIVPGRLGQVAHTLEERAATNGQIDGGGTFYGTRITTRRGLRSLIGFEKDRPNEPFAANAAWLPTTQVVVRVPELVLLPRIVIHTSSGFLNFGGDRDLGPAGMPGLRMVSSRWVDDALAAAVTAAARPLAGVGAPYLSFVVDHGLVSLVRNGFVPAEGLDHLVAVTGAVAESLAATVSLPAGTPPWCVPQDHEADVFGRAATEFSLSPIDPVELHRTARLLPFPGRALGALLGTLPGSHATGRVAFAVQGRHTSGSYRTVVLADAAPGASTPLGGILHQPTDQYAEVVDGLAVTWPRVRSVGRLDAADRIAAGLTTLRDLGLATV